MKPGLAPALAGIIALAASPGCGVREGPESALARSRAEHLEGQIRGLEQMIAQAERGELDTTDLIAIGLAEELAAELFNASLPLERVVAGRLRLRVESAEPFFRGTKATLMFNASVASTDIESASATLQIAGTLENYQLDRGRLRARVSLDHVTVVESGAGELAAGALEAVLRANTSVIEEMVPLMEFPVQLEEAIAISGLTEGAVVARPGRLPLQMAVEHVIVGDGRIWVLIAAATGEWEALEPAPSPSTEGKPEPPSPAEGEAAT